MNPKKKKLPPVSEALVEYLDRDAFPLRSPSIKDSEREIFVRVGERKVVEFLKRAVTENRKAEREARSE